MRWILLFFILFFCLDAQALELKSSDFENGGFLPEKCAYNKSNVPPSFSWGDLPEGTKTLAIICDDPDVPGKTWVHWVIFNILPGTENSGVDGVNDFGKTGYGGPYPPTGKPHRYFFKLYALDTILPLREGATKEELLGAMEGHILDSAEIIGLYKR